VDAIALAAAVVAASPPVVLAVLGETVAEKSGVINLSLDGLLLLTAMVAFAAARMTGSVLAGMGAAMAVGAASGLVVAVASLTLRQPQVATGFVLTLLCQNLAYVLGAPVAHLPGPQIGHAAIPFLRRWPVVGPVFFDQDALVYASLAATAGVWWYLFKTAPGLAVRGAGEHPAAAAARGLNVIRLRYLYTVVGGAMVGLGGAAFSLAVKPGWSRPYGIEGTGWIVLAIVIFGNWDPIRGAAGAYLFVLLQTLGTVLQSMMPRVPTQIFATLPFPLMILALLLVALGNSDWIYRRLHRWPAATRRRVLRALRALQASPPASLGASLEQQ
jgi:general nucleoside transport system permease protein